MIYHSKPSISNKEFEVLEKLFRNGQLAVGDEISKFEANLSNYVGVKYSAAVVNGTAALHLALLSLGVGEKSEVVIPNSACAALLNAVRMSGAKPILVDTNSYDCNISVESLKEEITSKTSCIIAPHHFGFPCKIEEINSFGIPVIEDCAQTVGAKISGKQVGSLTDISVFSFYATKVLTSIDGGMVLSNQESLIEDVKDRTYYGGKTDSKLRFNYKLNNVCAAIGNVQLEKLDEFILRRKKLYEFYDKNTVSNKIEKLKAEPNCEPCFYRFVFKLKIPAKSFRERMESLGIACGDAVFFPLNRMLGESDQDFTETIEWFENGVSIPLYPSLTDKEAEKVVEITNKVLKEI